MRPTPAKHLPYYTTKPKGAQALQLLDTDSALRIIDSIIDHDLKHNPALVHAQVPISGQEDVTILAGVRYATEEGIELIELTNWYILQDGEIFYMTNDDFLSDYNSTQGAKRG